MNTKTKILIAALLSRLVRTSRSWLKIKKTIFKRSNIFWSLDLAQGIDFAIYLQGGFEPSTIRCYRSLVRQGDVVIDVGANIGAHTLPLALIVGENGKVIAFEPTDFAFAKLQRNLELNPTLRSRVTSIQAMLVGDISHEKPSSIPSSWSLEKQSSSPMHPIHFGTYQSLLGASIITLDEWATQNTLVRLDFVKIDVDGYEIDVVEGGTKTLSKHSPVIMMEFAPYLFEERGRSFSELLRILERLRYKCQIVGGPEVSLTPTMLRYIPDGGSINVILRQK